MSYPVVMNKTDLHIREGIRLQELYSNKEIDIILGNKEPNNTELFKLYHKCLSFNDVDTITRLMNMYDLLTNLTYHQYQKNMFKNHLIISLTHYQAYYLIMSIQNQILLKRKTQRILNIKRIRPS